MKKPSVQEATVPRPMRRPTSTQPLSGNKPRPADEPTLAIPRICRHPAGYESRQCASTESERLHFGAAGVDSGAARVRYAKLPVARFAAGANLTPELVRQKLVAEYRLARAGPLPEEMA